MMYDLIVRAKDNDNDAMLELIKKFRPLMLKYAKRLNYEDAYEDILLEFIRFIRSMNPNKLGDRQDKIVVSYIHKCVVNFYKKKISKAIEYKKEIALSNLTDDQLYYVKAQLIHLDETDILIEFGMEHLLSKREEEILYLVYVKGYSAAEIAKKWNRSRQAVNQLKNRALQKVTDKMGRTVDKV